MPHGPSSWHARCGRFAHDALPALRNPQFLRFLVIGGINTLFGFVLYSLGILAGLPVWLALLLGNIGGTIFSFFTTGRFVFRRFSWNLFPKFTLCYFVVYFVNLGSLAAVSGWLDDKILAQAVLALPMAALSYFILRTLVFPPAPGGS